MGSVIQKAPTYGKVHCSCNRECGWRENESVLHRQGTSKKTVKCGFYSLEQVWDLLSRKLKNNGKEHSSSKECRWRENKQKEILKKTRIFENISDHKNIISTYGAYYNHASAKMPHYEGLWVSTELYTGTSLKELINSQKQKSLPENTIAYICKEVLQGLSHLDKNKVIHHDLRPGNIMVASSGDVKIKVMANIGNNTLTIPPRLMYGHWGYQRWKWQKDIIVRVTNSISLFLNAPRKTQLGGPLQNSYYHSPSLAISEMKGV
ncbi:hypothetical protein XELAEV_18015761mg [Xenopus laevis]|uniref:Protein kinase domain-containing protein n=1 Tax=Xenopus laevis TaxID=8355 RepID=A0A974DIM8_XENLA|nr:hypothetical protein XELAEV_18015761mg [Xenopus laevis]